MSTKHDQRAQAKVEQALTTREEVHLRIVREEPDAAKKEPSVEVRASQVVQEKPSLAFEVIPARSEDGIQEVVGLEAVMQSLVLSARHPLALEIAGSPTRKRFLVRATNEIALSHAEQQLRLRYPQADIRRMSTEDDPLQLFPNEAVTVAELRPGAAAYLPMREWSPETLQQQKGIDPLLGVLAALGTVPKDHRAVAQISLAPAPATWSKPHQRKAIEHALEPERNARQEELAMARSSDGVPSIGGLIFLGLILAALLFWQQIQRIVPPWFGQTFVELLEHQHLPAQSSEQRFQFFGGMALALFVLIGLFVGIAFLKQLTASPVYDQRLVASRTGRFAYRGHIRLFVLGPQSSHSSLMQRKEQEHVRRAALDSLVAAYRQFQTADAGRFVPHILTAHTCERLFSPPMSRAARMRSFLAWRTTTLGNWGAKVGTALKRMPLFQKATRQIQRLRTRVAQWVHKRWEEHLRWGVGARNVIRWCWTRIRTCLFWRMGVWLLSRVRSLLAYLWQLPLLQKVRAFFWSIGAWLLSHLRGPLSFANHCRRHLLQWLIEHVQVMRSEWVRTHVPLPGWASDIGRSRHFFTGDFLGSAWRLPGRADLGDLASLAQKRERTLPLPPALQNTQEEECSIGECSHGGVTYPFVIPPGFFGNHTFLGGKSGEGKSTLMVHLAKAVVDEGKRGFFLLDPHGDLAHDVLRAIPETRYDDVVLIDLGDADFCVGLNPLDVTLGRDRDLVVSALISVFSHIWQTSWGPRMEAPFRAAILTLLEANTTLVERDRLHGPDEQHTLLDVVQVLVDESFCHDLLEMTEDLFIHRFWYEYYSPLNLAQQRERIDPVLTKMMQFESKVARRILGQGRSTIRLDELVNARKMLIVRLAFSEAGAQTGSLIGATLLGLLMVTLREQSRLMVEERARMVLFLDEFQSFGAGADLSQLLAELRKYGGSAVLATQSLEYLSAIDPVLLPTVQANTKQYFLFRLSATDAISIAPELDIAPADLVNLDTHTCYVRLVSALQQQPTFSLRLQRPVLEAEEQLTVLRDQSQRMYCRRASDVERQIVLALGRAIAASLSRQQASERSKTTTQNEEESKSGTEESKQSPQFGKAKKRKKGLVTSFDRFPYIANVLQDDGKAEEPEETGE